MKKNLQSTPYKRVVYFEIIPFLNEWIYFLNQ